MRLLVFTKPLDVYSPFIETCEKLSKQVRVIYPEQHPKRKDPAFEEMLGECREFKPDVIISFYYNRIIQAEFLSLAQLAVNFHGSLLPNYAGSHALNWQIINGEKISGVTIHELTSAIDGGKIIDQDSFCIDFEDTAREVLKKGIDCSVGLLTSFIKDYQLGEVKLREQMKSGAEFVCRKRSPTDGEITKDMSQLEAYNMIRALVSPWPGAFYYDKDDNKVILNEYLSMEEVKRIL